MANSEAGWIDTHSTASNRLGNAANMAQVLWILAMIEKKVTSMNLHCSLWTNTYCYITIVVPHNSHKILFKIQDWTVCLA